MVVHPCSVGLVKHQDITTEEANMAVSLLIDIILNSQYDAAAQVAYMRCTPCRIIACMADA